MDMEAIKEDVTDAIECEDEFILLSEIRNRVPQWDADEIKAALDELFEAGEVEKADDINAYRLPVL